MTQGAQTGIRRAWRSSVTAGLVVAVVAGLMLWLSHGFGAWASSRAQLTAAQAEQQTYLADGWWGQRPLLRPATVTLSADGSFVLAGVTWSSWTASEASGAGTGRINDCQPNCAQGTYQNYPVQVRLGVPKDVCGRHFFTRVYVTWPAAVPSGWARSDSWPQIVQC